MGEGCKDFSQTLVFYFVLLRYMSIYSRDLTKIRIQYVYFTMRAFRE
jgi:hypothetical protein